MVGPGSHKNENERTHIGARGKARIRDILDYLVLVTAEGS